MQNGLRVSKSKTAKKWVKEKKLDVVLADLCYCSGQHHHGKPPEYKKELAEIGFLKQSDVGTNNGETPYQVFGKSSIVFPLRNENDKVVSFYAKRIDIEKEEFLKREGLYPSYPHPSTKRIYLTKNLLAAAMVISSKILDNKEAVISLYNGEWTTEHLKAIENLKELKEIIYLP